VLPVYNSIRYSFTEVFWSVYITRPTCDLFEDYVTQEAAKILRLLHIRELRELQTLANEAIIAVQKLTANPKTDTKLGKVGIWQRTVYSRLFEVLFLSVECILMLNE